MIHTDQLSVFLLHVFLQARSATVRHVQRNNVKQHALSGRIHDLASFTSTCDSNQLLSRPLPPPPFFTLHSSLSS